MYLKPKIKLNYVEVFAKPICTGVQFPPSPQKEKSQTSCLRFFFLWRWEQSVCTLCVGIEPGAVMFFQQKKQTSLGELGMGPKRKTGARRREVWSGNFSVEKYSWSRKFSCDGKRTICDFNSPSRVVKFLLRRQ